MKTKNVLIIPKWNYTVPVVWPVALELIRRGYRPHFVLHHYDENTLEWLRERDVPTTTLNVNKVASAPLWMSVVGIAGFNADVRVKRWAEGLLSQVRPVAVLVCDDRTPLELAVIRLANRASLPTVVMHWAFSNLQVDYDMQRQALLERFGESAKKESFMFGTQSWLGDSQSNGSASFRTNLDKLYTRRPLWLRPFLGMRKWVTQGLTAKLKRMADVDYQWIRIYGGGEARYFAVLGPAYLEQFATEGVPRGKMVVTGLIDHDALYNLEQEDIDRLRQQVITDFQCDAQRPIAYWATRPSVEDGYPAEAGREEVQTILKALLARRERWQVMIKLHPRTNVERFRSWLDDQPDVMVVKDYDKTALLCACDLFLSTYSTTILDALAFDKPVFCYNLLRIPGGDIFSERIGGVMHARYANEVEPQLALLLDDAATQERLRQERGQARQQYVVFDGRVAERVADLLLAKEAAATASVR